jgi:hypothetical protein
MTDQELDHFTARLRTLANRADPVPPSVIDAARAAFAWRTIDAELAELTYDSALEDRALAGVRGASSPRRLTFESPGLTVEVEVGEGAVPRLMGQLVPALGGTVELRHAGGSLSLAVDELGRFAVEQIPAGPLSLRCRAGADAAVETEWVAI